MMPKETLHDHPNVHQETQGPRLTPNELIDQLLAQVEDKNAELILGESGLAGLLKKQPAERILAAELTHHLATETAQAKAGNHRTGTSSKTVITPNGELKLDIPRDLQATFERNWSPSISAACLASTTT